MSSYNVSRCWIKFHISRFLLSEVLLISRMWKNWTFLFGAGRVSAVCVCVENGNVPNIIKFGSKAFPIPISNTGADDAFPKLAPFEQLLSDLRFYALSPRANVNAPKTNKFFLVFDRVYAFGYGISGSLSLPLLQPTCSDCAFMRASEIMEMHIKCG